MVSLYKQHCMHAHVCAGEDEQKVSSLQQFYNVIYSKNMYL